MKHEDDFYENEQYHGNEIATNYLIENIFRDLRELTDHTLIAYRLYKVVDSKEELMGGTFVPEDEEDL